MRTIFLFVGALGLLAGCGDTGSSTGADRDAGAICRAPTGCTATLVNGGCIYGCPADGGVIQRVCLPLPDGGAAEATDFASQSFPLGLVQSQVPYATNVDADPLNCTRCGRRCAAGQVCGRAPLMMTVDCYRP